MRGTTTIATGRHPQVQGPPLQHEPCFVSDELSWVESLAFICPAQCSIPDMAALGVSSKFADMRAHAIGALTKLSATAKNAMKSLDLRPDIWLVSVRTQPARPAA